MSLRHRVATIFTCSLLAVAGSMVADEPAQPKRKAAPAAISDALLESLLEDLGDANRRARAGRHEGTSARSDAGGRDRPETQETSNQGTDLDDCADCDPCVAKNCPDHCECQDVIVFGERDSGSGSGSSDPCASPCNPARCPSGCGATGPPEPQGGGVADAPEAEEGDGPAEEVSNDCTIDCFSQMWSGGWAPPRLPDRQCSEITRPSLPGGIPGVPPRRETTKAIEQKLPSGTKRPDPDDTEPPPPADRPSGAVVSERPGEALEIVMATGKVPTHVDWGCSGKTVGDGDECADPNIYFGECDGDTFYQACFKVGGEETQVTWGFGTRAPRGHCSCRVINGLPEGCV